MSCSIIPSPHFDCGRVIPSDCEPSFEHTVTFKLDEPNFDIRTNGPQALYEVRGILNAIPYINSGGCGISAVAMYRWLSKKGRLLPDTKFAYLYFSSSIKYYNTNIRAMQDRDIEPTACSHAALIHENRFLDSKRELRAQDFDLIQMITDEEFMIASINNRIQWNDSFDRETWIPVIERKLGIDLLDINI